MAEPQTAADDKEEAGRGSCRARPFDQPFGFGRIDEPCESASFRRTPAPTQWCDPVEPRPATAGSETARRLDFIHQALVAHLSQSAVEHARPELHLSFGTLEDFFRDREPMKVAIRQRQQDLKPLGRERSSVGRHGGSIYDVVYTSEQRGGDSVDRHEVVALKPRCRRCAAQRDGEDAGEPPLSMSEARQRFR